jgi:RNA-binding protein
MLSGKDRRALRAQGHHLKPVVQIGQGGITPGLLEAIERALGDHELIKVKVLEGAPLERDEAAEELAEACKAEVAQTLGRTILLYRENPEDRKVALPGKPLPKEAPEAARHGHLGGEGDRPAARRPRRSITQGALDEAPAGRGKKAPQAPRKGTGAKLPPRRHRGA